MNWKDRIEVNPAVLVGKPVIKDTRISVELILDRMADGWTMEDVLAAYPHVSREDVLAALSFASELFKEETLLTKDVRVALAVRLFDDEVISIGMAANLAGMHQSEFIDHLGALKIPLVRYGKKELQQEMAAFE